MTKYYEKRNKNDLMQESTELIKRVFIKTCLCEESFTCEGRRGNLNNEKGD